MLEADDADGSYQQHMFVVGIAICIQTETLRNLLRIFLEEQAHSEAPQCDCRD
jgi:hypothetical protein